MRMSWMCAAVLLLCGANAGAAPPRAGTLPSFAAVAKAIGPAVVRVDVSGAAGEAAASGILLDTRGDVVTSGHAFAPAGRAGAIAVTLADGRRLPAELLGTDAASDVAVIRLAEPPHDLSAARFGDSDDASVGQWVLAVGRSLESGQGFTAGIISARPQLPEAGGRGDVLLTDASVNPGDAGGALVDLEGEVVGLTALMAAGPGGGYGYAIPINQVRRVAQAIVIEGHASHPFIGVGLRQLPGGAVISRVGHDTPAARAGLQPGDVITAVDDRDVAAPAELVSFIERQPIGARVAVAFTRAGQSRQAVVSVEDLSGN